MEYLLNMLKIKAFASVKSSTKLVPNLLPVNLHSMTFVASRQQTVQRDELVYLYFKKFEHHNFSLAIIPLDGRNRAMYVETEPLKKIYRQLLHSIDSEEKFSLHLKDYFNLIQEYRRAESVFRNVTADKGDVLNSFLHYAYLTEKTGDFAWMPYAIENTIDVELKEYLKHAFPYRAQEFFEVISSPTRLHAYQQMRLDLCRAVMENKTLPGDIRLLVEKYSWYGEYSYIEPLYDMEYFCRELELLSVENAQIESPRLLNEIQHNKKRYGEVMEQIQDPHIRLCAKIINEYVFLRTDRTDTRKRIQMHFRNVYEKLAELLTVDSSELWKREDVVCLLNSEIEKYLVENIVPDKKIVAGRLRDYLYIRNKHGTSIYSDSAVVQNAIQTITKADVASQRIQGFSAFKGVATGPVAFVSSKADLDKVMKGSVLVARTTMIDYIQAMERSVAIVTDEGGITSHAAIVARELKKPCVVGTKNSTKLLKDNDMVEVDAYNGIVRLIK
jgi:phosphohistidine swiveling domain-containing protein